MTKSRTALIISWLPEIHGFHGQKFLTGRSALSLPLVTVAVATVISFMVKNPVAAQSPAVPPVQQVPSQQVPAQQVPVQQVPAQQVPMQQVPVQQVPVQQAPVQQVPVQQVPLLQMPIQPKVPVGQVPVQPQVPVGQVQAPQSPAATVFDKTSPFAPPVTQQSLHLRGIAQSLQHAGWDPVSMVVYSYVVDHFVAQEGAQNQMQSVQLDAETSNALRAFHLDAYETGMLGEFKCIAMVHKVFKRGSRYIIVQGYEFQEPIGANAAYAYLRKGSTNVLTRGDGSSEDADSISFFQDTCFFRLTGTSLDDDESKEVITKLSDNIVTAIGRHAPPPAILTLMPVIDRVKGTEKVVLGPLTAGKIVSMPCLDALSIGRARAGAVADYQMFIPFRERLKLLCIDYGNDVLAEQMFNNYQSKLTELNKAGVTVAANRSFVFKQGKQFLFCELKSAGRVVVISGARKREASALLARSI